MIIVGSSAAWTSTLSASVSLTVSCVLLTRSLGETSTLFPYTTLFRSVDARITVSGSSTNAVGSPHTFTVTVEKNLGVGGGFVAAAGETRTAEYTSELETTDGM